MSSLHWAYGDIEDDEARRAIARALEKADEEHKELVKLRAALERARALANEWIEQDGETYGAKLLAQMGRRLAAALGAGGEARK